MIRTGTGFDAHRLVAGRDLILGGVRVEFELGLAGHSDADVLCHAIADALLGAVADGDIGKHFPDNDPAWKDASSIGLLKETAERVRALSAEINNVDATIIAERPKLAPHVPEMRRNLADALGIPASHVSVKATTVEGMGSLGRGEGIAAMAVATVDQECSREGAAKARPLNWNR
jgi:2-C-methyl-D-erythritol 2,4-cyclodiphosphate synthase